jgi:aryl-alcohol dehydrogenase-like predicted oxidoreductase
MGMSGVYGPAAEDDSIATIHAAVEADITLIDTGDFYGMGHNEMLIGRALADTPRDAYRLSVKFGASEGPTVPGSATTPAPRRSRPRPPTRCSGYGLTTSTSTAPRALTRRCRSRRRSARSASS